MGLLKEEEQNAILRMSADGEVCSDMRRPTFRYTPEESLWSACLHEAVLTYLGAGVCTREKDRQEAREWFAAHFDSEVPAPVGSYEWTCIILEIDPVQFRRRLLLLEERSGGDGRTARRMITEMRKGLSSRRVAQEPAA